ncbi:GLPGLI family protein [Bergeyella sp. RCAD1439]|uniref:GLPGLI family protein n=1 Tax=Bergeyella anatis TaxID=3113737 RepID=UPI002E1997C3|nr:GLPGLI family protein [Bergeyella sp. RCAD1439]
MQKKIILLVWGLFSVMAFPQATRFVYQLSMKSDSTAAPVAENAFLDVADRQSYFYGEKDLKRDSLFRRSFETRNFNFDRSQMQQYRSQIDYQISKDLDASKIIYKSRIGRDRYAYEEDRPISWNIQPETSTLDRYKVQKAETNFAGRHWVAWFTTEIPITDGPYKFHGLPGLIVKVEDDRGDYIFELKETRKIEAVYTPESMGRAPMTVKRKDYVKQMEKYRKDPVAFLNSQTSAMGPPPGGPGGEARTFTPDPQRQKEMQQRIKESLQKENNPLEKN